jgi:hypothetical protein
MSRQTVNTGPILALVAAEIAAFLIYTGSCEARGNPERCEIRWGIALPGIALAVQSAATYFMQPSGSSRAPSRRRSSDEPEA